MTKASKQSAVALVLTLLLLVVDQVIKILVKTNMEMHQQIVVTEWFRLLFTENNGMAFGMELTPKIFLTTFRMIAIVFGIYYIARLIREKISWGFLICLVGVLAGAIGNIIDCMFYGLIFDAPAYGVAHVVPWGEGYATFGHGRVVDMFYFPLVEWNWPTWMPWVGGEHFIFFSPIFNFADACISCGVIAILLFYRNTFAKLLSTEKSA